MFNSRTRDTNRLGSKARAIPLLLAILAFFFVVALILISNAASVGASGPGSSAKAEPLSNSNMSVSERNSEVKPARPAPRGRPPMKGAQTDLTDPERPERAPVDELTGRAARPDVITSGKWTNISPELLAVDATSAADAWALGELGYVLHYTGGSWQYMETPDVGYTRPTDIAAIAPNNVVVAGSYYFYQYNGTTWSSYSPSSPIYIFNLSALSNGDIWAIGDLCTSTCHDTIAHWNGSDWVDATPGLLPETTYLYDIVMVSSTEGWAVGYDYNSVTSTSTPVMLHYNGSSWSQFTPPMTSGQLYSVDGNVPGEVWATGYDSSDYTYRIYRYSGGTWTSWISLDYTYNSKISVLGSNDVYVAAYESILHWDGAVWTREYQGQQFRGIAGASGQVWAVAGGETILSRTGSGSWLKQRGGPTSYSLYGIASVAENDVWAVGSFTTGPQGSTIVHYDGTSWQPFTNTLTTTLYDVQLSSATDGYAVGSNAIVHWNGTSWTRIAQPSGILYGVSLSGPGQGWAVGTGGQMWRGTAGSWVQVSSPVTSTLYSVAMDSATHGWAVGYVYQNPTYVAKLLEFNGATWQDRSSLVPSTVKQLRRVILEPGGQNGWAVGSRSGSGTSYAIMRLSNGVWSADTTTTASSLYSVNFEALGETWAIGCSIYHNVGGAWENNGLPSRWCLRGSVVTLGRSGWAVGPYGVILKYTPLAPGQRFYDVPLNSAFYSFIECMATRGIINGYQADNTFRPGNNVTRGQLSKIVSESAAFVDNPGPQRFEDVPPASTFYTWTNRLNIHGVIGGYPCGGLGEPCGGGNLPYFRSGSNASRGQISKIVSEAAGFVDPPGTQLFEDVSPSSTFFDYIQRLASRGVMNGYPCGGVGEPCGVGNRPYFRPASNATRGQTAKIVTNTFFPGCTQEATK